MHFGLFGVLLGIFTPSMHNTPPPESQWSRECCHVSGNLIGRGSRPNDVDFGPKWLLAAIFLPAKEKGQHPLLLCPRWEYNCPRWKREAEKKAHGCNVQVWNTARNICFYYLLTMTKRFQVYISFMKSRACIIVIALFFFFLYWNSGNRKNTWNSPKRGRLEHFSSPEGKQGLPSCSNT